jgi:glycosyltransferase involved in cell wall biosynthesis
MMEIVVDISKISDLNCGLGQFSYHLNKELYSLDTQISFYQKSDSEKAVGKRLFKKKWHRSNLIYRPSCKVWHATHQDVDVYPVSSSVQKVLTIHDLNYLYEENSKEKRDKYLKSLQSKINQASALTFISEFTRSEVLKHLNIEGKKNSVIYNGYCLDNVNAKKPDSLNFKDYIFCLGTVVPKKNYQLVIDIAKERDDLIFVLAGTLFHDHAKDLIQQVSKEALQDRVLFLGEVSESEKRYLYENAKLFFHPSLLEGFGLPVIESMALGLPVVSSNACSLPEVLGGYGFLFEPSSKDAAICAIDKALNQLELGIDRSKLKGHAEMFSWKESAKAYYELYHRVLS